MVGAAGWLGGLVGAVAVGASLLPGTLPAPAGGVGGPPWAPGTGSELACGSLGCGATDGAAVGATAVGVAGGVAVLAVGWIVALGGIGALPC